MTIWTIKSGPWAHLKYIMCFIPSKDGRCDQYSQCTNAIIWICLYHSTCTKDFKCPKHHCNQCSFGSITDRPNETGLHTSILHQIKDTFQVKSWVKKKKSLECNTSCITADFILNQSIYFSSLYMASSRPVGAATNYHGLVSFFVLLCRVVFLKCAQVPTNIHLFWHTFLIKIMRGGTISHDILIFQNSKYFVLEI